MPIFKSRWGGYYSADHKHIANDVQMVRLASTDEIKNKIEELRAGDKDIPEVYGWHIDSVLKALTELTPDGTDRKAWKELHNVI